MSKLLRTKLVLENCRTHLDASNSPGSEVESYLSQHVLVVLCADTQQHFYEILENRISEVTDPELCNFAISTGKRALRSIGKSELAGFVGHFGQDAQRFLNEDLEERVVTMYNNAVQKRHDVAHNSGSNITFRELDEILAAAETVISTFERAISSSRLASSGS